MLESADRITGKNVNAGDLSDLYRNQCTRRRRKSCNLTPVANVRDTQDGLTSFYLILPAAGISVTRRAAALLHASGVKLTFTRTPAPTWRARARMRFDASERIGVA